MELISLKKHIESRPLPRAFPRIHFPQAQMGSRNNPLSNETLFTATISYKPMHGYTRQPSHSTRPAKILTFNSGTKWLFYKVSKSVLQRGRRCKGHDSVKESIEGGDQISSIVLLPPSPQSSPHHRPPSLIALRHSLLIQTLEDDWVPVNMDCNSSPGKAPFLFSLSKCLSFSLYLITSHYC